MSEGSTRWQKLSPTTSRRRLQWLRWVGLFLALLGATWAATQSSQAPALLLLAILQVAAINLALPASHGNASLVGVVSVAALLILGLPMALGLLLATLLLGPFLRPLWTRLWEGALEADRPLSQPRARKWGRALFYLLALAAGGGAYLQSSEPLPLQANGFTLQAGLLWLLLVYGFVHMLGQIVLWFLAPPTVPTAFPLLPVLAEGFLSHPFSLLGAMALLASGLPAFVIFSTAAFAATLILWQSWQRRHQVDLQLFQFVLLNDLGKSLRETLDLDTVFHHVAQLLHALFNAEHCMLALEVTPDTWQHVLLDVVDPSKAPSVERRRPDDFTRWVHQRGAILELDTRNMHFAARHGLRPPQPPPLEWVGVPLNASGKSIGVLTLQRYAPGQRLGTWSRQLLRAVAGLTSSALQNARLHEETVRLLNMTDEQLTNRLEQLQALLDAMQEGVLLIDATATIVLLNTTATKLFGDSSAPGLGDQVDSLVSIGALGYRSDEFEALLHNLRTGRGISAQPVVFEAAGGDRSAGQKPRFVQRAETQVIATDGSLLGCLMLFRDITEERELESMRIDLSRMIVHDLRNPLTTLTTTIELLASRLRNNGMTTTQAENLSLIELVQQGALDMLDMVDSLMDMSRLESGRAVLDAEAMRFPEAARKLLVRLEPLAKQRQIALQFQFEEHLPAVWADEDMVRRVVLNLLDNALKFTPAGGQIRLEVQRESSSRADAHDGLRCSIIDNGPGIPPEAQSHIFDRFMRTNTGGAQLRGTGLGLAFCRLAIEAHGGSIWVEAEPGAGSTFVFTLPGVPR